MPKKDITIFVANVQGLMVFNKEDLRVYLTELEFHLLQLRPHIVFLQETWLDAPVESVTIANYRIVSRKDRKDTTNRGGILTLVRNDLNRLVFIGDSATEERSWHFLHADPEVLLVGNWYAAYYWNP